MSIDIVYVVILSTILLFVGLLPLALELIRGKADPLNPRNLFLLYLLLQIGVYPLYVIASGRGFKLLDINSRDDIRSLCLGLFISIIAIICYHLGYMAVMQQTARHAKDRIYVFNPNRVVVVLIAILPLSAYFAYLVFLERGGFSGYVETFNEKRYSGGGGGYQSFFSSGFVCFLAILAFLGGRNSVFSKKLWRVSAVLFAFSLILTGLGGFRVSMAPVLLSGIACYHYYVRRLRPAEFFVVLLLVIILFSVYGISRALLEARSSNQDIDVLEGRISVIDSVVLRSAGAEMVAITVAHVDQHKNFQYFLPGLLEAVSILVPRALWEGKPVPQGLVFGQQFMEYYMFIQRGGLSAETGGHSMTAVAYLYWQMGIWAVIFGMIFLGAFFGLLYRLFCESARNDLVAFLFLSIYGSSPMFSEALQESINALVITIFLVIFLSVFVTDSRSVKVPSGPLNSRAS